MPSSYNTSFIPKKNTTSRVRSGSKRKVFVVTFLIRVIFFATLLSSIGVYLYEKKLDADLADEKARLYNAIGSFKEADFSRVLEMDNRLNQTQYRLAHTASILSVLQALEKSTLAVAEISSLEIKRPSDDLLELESVVKTGDFDSAVFQREMLKQNDKLTVTEIDDVTLGVDTPKDGSSQQASALTASDKEFVTFKALLTVSTDKIPHQIVDSSTISVPADIEETVPEDLEIETEVNDELRANQTGI